MHPDWDWIYEWILILSVEFVRIINHAFLLSQVMSDIGQ